MWRQGAFSIGVNDIDGKGDPEAPLFLIIFQA
jgi:hypothetical protein